MSIFENMSFVNSHIEEMNNLYGSNMTKIKENVSHIDDILTNNIGLAKKLFISSLKKERQIDILKEHFKFSDRAIEHNKKDEVLNTLKSYIYSDTLEEVYKHLSQISLVPEQEFLYTWLAMSTTGYIENYAKLIKE